MAVSACAATGLPHVPPPHGFETLRAGRGAGLLFAGVAQRMNIGVASPLAADAEAMMCGVTFNDLLLEPLAEGAADSAMVVPMHDVSKLYWKKVTDAHTHGIALQALLVVPQAKDLLLAFPGEALAVGEHFVEVVSRVREAQHEARELREQQQMALPKQHATPPSQPLPLHHSAHAPPLSRIGSGYTAPSTTASYATVPASHHTAPSSGPLSVPLGTHHTEETDRSPPRASYGGANPLAGNVLVTDTPEGWGPSGSGAHGHEYAGGDARVGVDVDIGEDSGMCPVGVDVSVGHLRSQEQQRLVASEQGRGHGYVDLLDGDRVDMTSTPSQRAYGVGDDEQIMVSPLAFASISPLHLRTGAPGPRHGEEAPPTTPVDVDHMMQTEVRDGDDVCTTPNHAASGGMSPFDLVPEASPDEQQDEGSPVDGRAATPPVEVAGAAAAFSNSPEDARFHAAAADAHHRGVRIEPHNMRVYDISPQTAAAAYGAPAAHVWGEDGGCVPMHRGVGGGTSHDPVDDAYYSTTAAMPCDDRVRGVGVDVETNDADVDDAAALGGAVEAAREGVFEEVFARGSSLPDVAMSVVGMAYVPAALRCAFGHAVVELAYMERIERCELMALYEDAELCAPTTRGASPLHDMWKITMSEDGGSDSERSRSAGGSVSDQPTLQSDARAATPPVVGADAIASADAPAEDATDEHLACLHDDEDLHPHILHGMAPTAANAVVDCHGHEVPDASAALMEGQPQPARGDGSECMVSDTNTAGPSPVEGVAGPTPPLRVGYDGAGQLHHVVGAGGVGVDDAIRAMVHAAPEADAALIDAGAGLAVLEPHSRHLQVLPTRCLDGAPLASPPTPPARDAEASGAPAPAPARGEEMEAVHPEAVVEAAPAVGVPCDDAHALPLGSGAVDAGHDGDIASSYELPRSSQGVEGCYAAVGYGCGADVVDVYAAHAATAERGPIDSAVPRLPHPPAGVSDSACAGGSAAVHAHVAPSGGRPRDATPAALVGGDADTYEAGFQPPVGSQCSYLPHQPHPTALVDGDPEATPAAAHLVEDRWGVGVDGMYNEGLVGAADAVYAQPYGPTLAAGADVLETHTQVGPQHGRTYVCLLEGPTTGCLPVGREGRGEAEVAMNQPAAVGHDSIEETEAYWCSMRGAALTAVDGPQPQEVPARPEEEEEEAVMMENGESCSMTAAETPHAPPAWTSVAGNDTPGPRDAEAAEATVAAAALVQYESLAPTGSSMCGFSLQRSESVVSGGVMSSAVSAASTSGASATAARRTQEAKKRRALDDALERAAVASSSSRPPSRASASASAGVQRLLERCRQEIAERGGSSRGSLSDVDVRSFASMSLVSTPVGSPRRGDADIDACTRPAPTSDAEADGHAGVQHATAPLPPHQQPCPREAKSTTPTPLPTLEEPVYDGRTFPAGAYPPCEHSGWMGGEPAAGGACACEGDFDRASLGIDIEDTHDAATVDTRVVESKGFYDDCAAPHGVPGLVNDAPDVAAFATCAVEVDACVEVGAADAAPFSLQYSRATVAHEVAGGEPAALRPPGDSCLSGVANAAEQVHGVSASLDAETAAPATALHPSPPRCPVSEECLPAPGAGQDAVEDEIEVAGARAEEGEEKEIEKQQADAEGDGAAVRCGEDPTHGYVYYTPPPAGPGAGGGRSGTPGAAADVVSACPSPCIFAAPQASPPRSPAGVEGTGESMPAPAWCSAAAAVEEEEDAANTTPTAAHSDPSARRSPIDIVVMTPRGAGAATAEATPTAACVTSPAPALDPLAEAAAVLWATEQLLRDVPATPGIVRRAGMAVPDDLRRDDAACVAQPTSSAAMCNPGIAVVAPGFLVDAAAAAVVASPPPRPTATAAAVERSIPTTPFSGTRGGARTRVPPPATVGCVALDAAPARPTTAPSDASAVDVIPHTPLVHTPLRAGSGAARHVDSAAAQRVSSAVELGIMRTGLTSVPVALDLSCDTVPEAVVGTAASAASPVQNDTVITGFTGASCATTTTTTKVNVDPPGTTTSVARGVHGPTSSAGGISQMVSHVSTSLCDPVPPSPSAVFETVRTEGHVASEGADPFPVVPVLSAPAGITAATPPSSHARTASSAATSEVKVSAVPEAASEASSRGCGDHSPAAPPTPPPSKPPGVPADDGWRDDATEGQWATLPETEVARTPASPSARPVVLVGSAAAPLIILREMEEADEDVVEKASPTHSPPAPLTTLTAHEVTIPAIPAPATISLCPATPSTNCMSTPVDGTRGGGEGAVTHEPPPRPVKHDAQVPRVAAAPAAARGSVSGDDVSVTTPPPSLRCAGNGSGDALLSQVAAVLHARRQPTGATHAPAAAAAAAVSAGHPHVREAQVVDRLLRALQAAPQLGGGARGGDISQTVTSYASTASSSVATAPVNFGRDRGGIPGSRGHVSAGSGAGGHSSSSSSSGTTAAPAQCMVTTNAGGGRGVSDGLCGIGSGAPQRRAAGDAGAVGPRPRGPTRRGSPGGGKKHYHHHQQHEAHKAAAGTATGSEVSGPGGGRRQEGGPLSDGPPGFGNGGSGSGGAAWGSGRDSLYPGGVPSDGGRGGSGGGSFGGPHSNSSGGGSGGSSSGGGGGGGSNHAVDGYLSVPDSKRVSPPPRRAAAPARNVVPCRPSSGLPPQQPAYSIPMPVAASISGSVMSASAGQPTPPTSSGGALGDRLPTEPLPPRAPPQGVVLSPGVTLMDPPSVSDRADYPESAMARLAWAGGVGHPQGSINTRPTPSLRQQHTIPMGGGEWLTTPPSPPLDGLVPRNAGSAVLAPRPTLAATEWASAKEGDARGVQTIVNVAKPRGGSVAGDRLNVDQPASPVSSCEPCPVPPLPTPNRNPDASGPQLPSALRLGAAVKRAGVRNGDGMLVDNSHVSLASLPAPLPTQLHRLTSSDAVCEYFDAVAGHGSRGRPGGANLLQTISSLGASVTSGGGSTGSHTRVPAPRSDLNASGYGVC